jgi:hypothetical protein
MLAFFTEQKPGREYDKQSVNILKKQLRVPSHA